jgi:hypothetical protein
MLTDRLILLATRQINFVNWLWQSFAFIRNAAGDIRNLAQPADQIDRAICAGRRQ